MQYPLVTVLKVIEDSLLNVSRKPFLISKYVNLAHMLFMLKKQILDRMTCIPTLTPYNLLTTLCSTIISPNSASFPKTVPFKYRYSRMRQPKKSIW